MADGAQSAGAVVGTFDLNYQSLLDAQAALDRLRSDAARGVTTEIRAATLTPGQAAAQITELGGIPNAAAAADQINEAVVARARAAVDALTASMPAAVENSAQWKANKAALMRSPEWAALMEAQMPGYSKLGTAAPQEAPMPLVMPEPQAPDLEQAAGVAFTDQELEQIPVRWPNRAGGGSPNFENTEGNAQAAFNAEMGAAAYPDAYRNREPQWVRDQRAALQRWRASRPPPGEAAGGGAGGEGEQPHHRFRFGWHQYFMGTIAGHVAGAAIGGAMELAQMFKDQAREAKMGSIAAKKLQMADEKGLNNLLRNIPMVGELLALPTTMSIQSEQRRLQRAMEDQVIAAKGVAQIDRERVAAAKAALGWDKAVGDAAGADLDTQKAIAAAYRQQLDALNTTYRNMEANATDEYQKGEILRQQLTAQRQLLAAEKEEVAAAKAQAQLGLLKTRLKGSDQFRVLAMLAAGKTPAQIHQAELGMALSDTGKTLVAHVADAEQGRVRAAKAALQAAQVSIGPATYKAFDGSVHVADTPQRAHLIKRALGVDLLTPYGHHDYRAKDVGAAAAWAVQNKSLWQKWAHATFEQRLTHPGYDSRRLYGFGSGFISGGPKAYETLYNFGKLLQAQSLHAHALAAQKSKITQDQAALAATRAAAAAANKLAGELAAAKTPQQAEALKKAVMANQVVLQAAAAHLAAIEAAAIKRPAHPPHPHKPPQTPAEKAAAKAAAAAARDAATNAALKAQQDRQLADAKARLLPPLQRELAAIKAAEKASLAHIAASKNLTDVQKKAREAEERHIAAAQELAAKQLLAAKALKIHHHHQRSALEMSAEAAIGWGPYGKKGKAGRDFEGAVWHNAHASPRWAAPLSDAAATLKSIHNILTTHATGVQLILGTA